MVSSTTELRYVDLLLSTSGLGVGVLSALPSALWVIYWGPSAARLSGIARLLVTTMTAIVVGSGLMICVYLSFQLSALARSTLATPDMAAFHWLLICSLLGFWLPTVPAVAISYDWSREYDVPALKRFLWRYSLIATVGAIGEIATYYAFRPAAAIVFLAILGVITMSALVELQRIRRVTKS